MQQVKYLGVPVHFDLKEHRKIAKASIERNLGFLLHKLRNVDLNIKDILTARWPGASSSTSARPW